MKIIETADRTPTLLRQLLEVWERSVRATHLFLSDGEIRQIKEYVPQALGGIEHPDHRRGRGGAACGVYGDRKPDLGDAVPFPGREGQRAGKTASPIRDGKTMGSSGLL